MANQETSQQAWPGTTVATAAIGTSAQAVDALPMLHRLRLERSTLTKLPWLCAGYFILIALTVWLIHNPASPEYVWSLSWWLVPSVALLAFIFETMDSAAGMGFGTALAPLLLAMGYDPLAVVPVLLISESVTGLISAAAHHEFSNVRFSLRRGMNEATKLMLMIACVGVASIVASIILVYIAIDLPDSVIKTYVAVLVLLMGIVAIVRRFVAHDTAVYRPKRMLGFAALAGLNKGIGGGGYGPVVTLGENYSGVYQKSAAAITSLAEGLVSIAGIATFFAISAVGVDPDLTLLPSVLAGSILGGVASPYLVRILPNRVFGYLIPLYATVIGIIVLTKLIMGAG